MKLQAVIISLLISNVSMMVHAQINESFDGSTFPPLGWSAYSTSGSTVWNRITSNTKDASAGAASSSGPATSVSKYLTLSLNLSASASTVTYFVAVSSVSSGTGATLLVQAGTDTTSMTTLRTIDLEDGGLFTANTYIQFTDNLNGTSASGQTGTINLQSQSVAYIRWCHQKVSGTAASCRLESVTVPNAAALPVELTFFTAIAKGRGVELIWKTATEVNNAGFEIEKKINGVWSKIGFVEGHGSTNAPQSYSFMDENANPKRGRGNVLYRLKQIDRDGEFEYSNIVESTVGVTAEEFNLEQNYPNPFNPATTISFALKTAEHVNLTVFTSLGQTVQTLFNGIAHPNESYSLKFNGRDLSSGTYFYVLRSASRNEVRIMSLMK